MLKYALPLALGGVFYILWRHWRRRYSRRLLQGQGENRKFLLANAHIMPQKLCYFRCMNFINDEFMCETECALTVSRLAFQFTGVHKHQWCLRDTVDFSAPIFTIFFLDFADNFADFGHEALVKDGVVYQSYLGHYRLKTEPLTNMLKQAIQDKNHQLFAFGKDTGERSIKIQQRVPPASYHKVNGMN